MKVLNVIILVMLVLFLFVAGAIIFEIVSRKPAETDNTLRREYIFIIADAESDVDDDFDIDEFIRQNEWEDEDFIEDDLYSVNHARLPLINGLVRDDDGILIGSMTLDEPILLKGASSVINVRFEPSSESERVTTIGLGQVVRVSEVVEGWYRVTVLPGMFQGFIRSDLLLRHDDSIQYFAEPFTTKVDFRGSTLESRLVDVRTIVPEIEYDIIFATPRNFTGFTLYSRDVPMLQAGTAEKLRQAQEIFMQDGYRIKLYDAYRPVNVSGILFSIVGDSRYVAPPGASTHNRAAAVDITLVYADGDELEMPSKMHTFNETSHRNSGAMSAEARDNMNYLTSVMTQCGFTTINTEWWHFNDSDSSRYPTMDFTFREFTFFAVERP